MWPELKVENETCWSKLNILNILRKWSEFTLFKLSVWILKSPTNIRSIFEEIWNSSSNSNSVKNVDKDDKGVQ